MNNSSFVETVTPFIFDWAIEGMLEDILKFVFWVFAVSILWPKVCDLWDWINRR